VLLFSEMAMVLDVGLLSDAVQLVLALLLKLDGEQDTEDNDNGAAAVSVEVAEPPLRLAVITAV
jgi:hypothetical protein